jgi:hypothetical protein
MTTWMTKMRNKLADLIGPKDHVDWQTWFTIWDSLYLKENLKHSPWIEFQFGANEQGILFEKMSFGLGTQEKPQLGKVSLTLLFGAERQLQLHKQNQEICSVVGAEIAEFWKNSVTQAYRDIQAKVNPSLIVGRLKIADDKQIQEEQKILQWIKTSLMVLKSAITKTQITNTAQQSQQFLTARILMGKLPLQDSLHIVVHCFNLEVVLLSTTNTKAWKLLVYDHKDGGLGQQTTTPVMNAMVELQLNAIWAELESLIKLVLKI